MNAPCIFIALDLLAHSVIAMMQIYIKVVFILVAITSSRYFYVNICVFDITINVKNGVMVGGICEMYVSYDPSKL